MVYVSPRGSVTGLHLEFGELFSVNLVIDGEKHWVEFPASALDALLKAISSYGLSYPGYGNRKKTCIPSCKNPACKPKSVKSKKSSKTPEAFCANTPSFCERGKPCDFCRCRVSAFHESYIFPTQGFLDEHQIPRAFIQQRAGDVVIINSSCAHLIYNYTDCAAGKVFYVYFFFKKKFISFYIFKCIIIFYRGC